MSRRVALKIAYRGKDFAGSQRQPGKRTVEGEVIADLEVIEKTGGDHGLKAASRTDAGVNALCNVMVVDTEFDDDETMLRALNAVSDRIFYVSAAEVPEGFDPRKAISRSYRYVMSAENLDLGLAKECASLFVGEHDFSMFCKTDDRSPIIELRKVEVSVSGGIMYVDFEARNFLWNLIRRIVAAIAAVASGKYPASRVADALAGDRMTFGLADPAGLIMTGIEYKHLQFPTFETTFSERLDSWISALETEKSFLESVKRL